MGNTQRTTLGPIPDTQTIVNNGKFVYEIYHARNRTRSLCVVVSSAGKGLARSTKEVIKNKKNK